MAGRRWTAEDDAFLREHWKRKKPKWIARQLKRTQSAIRRRAWSLIQKGRAKGDPEWTEKEDQDLIWYWSEKGPAYLARKLKRSRRAVETRAKALLGSLARRGMLTQKEVAERTGYLKEHVRQAVLDLGLHTRAEGDHGTWRLTYEQMDRVVEYLGNQLTLREVADHLEVTIKTVRSWAAELEVELASHRGARIQKKDLPRFEERSRQRWTRWATRYDCCVDCGGTDRPHKGGGRCTLCYGRNRRKARALRQESGQG